MANHKSALKRMRQAEKRRMINRARKSRMKTAIRAVEEAILAKNVEMVNARLREAVSIISRVAAKGTIHKNKAARKISRLTKKVNRFLASIQQSA